MSWWSSPNSSCLNLRLLRTGLLYRRNCPMRLLERIRFYSRDREGWLGSSTTCMNSLGVRNGCLTLVFAYGSEFPGKGGARLGTRSSYPLSVASALFSGSMSERRILKVTGRKGGLVPLGEDNLNGAQQRPSGSTSSVANYITRPDFLPAISIIIR